MPVSSTHQMIIDRIADKAVEAWTWAIGSDVNPSLLDGEAISEGHEAVRSAIRDDLDEVAQRAGQLGWSENTLRGNFFPQIWKTISGRGVLLEIENDEIVAARPRDLVRRLLKEDQTARQRYNEWQSNKESVGSKKRNAKQLKQVVWNNEVVDSMNDLCTDWLIGPLAGKDDKQNIGRHILAIAWFTGRRPWEEVALNLRINPEATGPDWASDWVEVSGIAKQTLAVKDGIEEEVPISIPLFDIDHEDLLAGLERLRALEAIQDWFDDEITNVSIRSILKYRVNSDLEGPILDCFSPVTEAGYSYTSEPKMFRALWVSHGYWRQFEWCVANGRQPANINGYAKRYIGHTGQSSDAATADYLRYTFLGDRPIPSLKV